MVADCCRGHVLTCRDGGVWLPVLVEIIIRNKKKEIKKKNIPGARDAMRLKPRRCRNGR